MLISLTSEVVLMVKLNREVEPTNFYKFGLSSEETSNLICSINKTINNYRVQNPTFDMSKCSNLDIFNTWKIFNPQYNNKDFEFFVEVIEYINSMKDETGVFVVS
jgi:hypothetical protein